MSLRGTRSRPHAFSSVPTGSSPTATRSAARCRSGWPPTGCSRPASSRARWSGSTLSRDSPARGGRITVDGRLDDGRVVVWVADNGPGIPTGYENRIFDLFVQVHRDANDAGASAIQGTGVGLAIVRRIVEQHRGDVWVESSPGEGSRFYVRFPREPS